MAQNDDVAGLSDNELINQKNTLKNRIITLQEMESKNALSQKLLVERNAVTERLDAIETRIAFRMREGAQGLNV